jgi:hypothetical protein
MIIVKAHFHHDGVEIVFCLRYCYAQTISTLHGDEDSYLEDSKRSPLRVVLFTSRTAFSCENRIAGPRVFARILEADAAIQVLSCDPQMLHYCMIAAANIGSLNQLFEKVVLGA